MCVAHRSWYCSRIFRISRAHFGPIISDRHFRYEAGHLNCFKAQFAENPTRTEHFHFGILAYEIIAILKYQKNASSAAQLRRHFKNFKLGLNNKLCSGKIDNFDCWAFQSLKSLRINSKFGNTPSGKDNFVNWKQCGGGLSPLLSGRPWNHTRSSIF